jgi:hypothetical protein
MLTRTHSLVVGLLLLLVLVAIPIAAAGPEATRPLPELFADRDTKVPPPEFPGFEDEGRHLPHVLFTMRRGIPGAQYRLILQREPRWNPVRDARPGVHCKLTTILSSWARANARGAAAWPLQPASFYTPLHNTELCPGEYLGKLEQRHRYRTRTVLIVWFEYPSLKLLGKRPR